MPVVKVEDDPSLFAFAGMSVDDVLSVVTGTAAGLAEELGVNAKGSDEEIAAAIIAAAEGKTPKPSKPEPKAEKAEG